MAVTTQAVQSKKRMSLALRGAVSFGVCSLLSFLWAPGIAVAGLAGALFLNEGRREKALPRTVALRFVVGFFIGGLIYNLHHMYHLWLTELLVPHMSLFPMLVMTESIPWIVGMTIAGAISGGSLGRGLSRIAGYGFLLGSIVGGLGGGVIVTLSVGGTSILPSPMPFSRTIAYIGLFLLGSVVMWVVTFAIGGAILGAALDRQEKRAASPESATLASPQP